MRSTGEAVIAGKSIWIGRLVIQMDARRRYLDRVQPTCERLVVPGMFSVIRRNELQPASAILEQKYARGVVEVPRKIGNQGPKWERLDRRLPAGRSRPFGLDDDGTQIGRAHV